MPEAVKSLHYTKAQARAQADPELAAQIATIVLLGMEEIAAYERFAGDGLGFAYNTHFPMPGGEEWQMSLRKRKIPA